MNGDDPYSTDWISALTPEERRKLIFLTSEMFALALSSPTAAMSMIGAGNRIAVDRRVQPIMALTTTGKLTPIVNTSGQITEASASSISTYTNYGYLNLENGNPLTTSAGGTVQRAAYASWSPIVPVTVTADGAGNPGAGTEIVAAPAAGYKNDCMIFLQVRTVAGATQYIHRFREDTGAALGAVIPAWTGVTIPHAANERFPNDVWGIRIMNTTAAKNIGIGSGVNGDWPNNAPVTFWGFYRRVT